MVKKKRYRNCCVWAAVKRKFKKKSEYKCQIWKTWYGNEELFQWTYQQTAIAGKWRSELGGITAKAQREKE